MLLYHLNFDKTLAAAAEVLRNHHGRMEHMRLLKLLYIADRELLAETGRTLTGDHAVAMKNGPVLSGVYDLIKSKGDPDHLRRWKETVVRDGHDVALGTDVSVGRLTRTELKKLQELCVRYRDVDSFDLSELTHAFAEWSAVFDRSNPKSCFPMTWEASLEAQGAGELIPEAEGILREKQAADAAFQER